MSGGNLPPEARASGAKITGFDAVFVRSQVRHFAQQIIAQFEPETVAECLDRVAAHFLQLMVDVLAFARFAHAEALHRFGEDHRRPAGLAGCRGVGVVDLDRVVAAAGEFPDLVVGHVADQLQKLRVFAEEVLAHIGAVL